MARLTHLPLLRASVSSPTKCTGWSAGIQRTARSKTTRPTASRLHCARAKNRWNTEMWRSPTAPEASATPVIVRRPRHWTQPITSH